MPSLPGLVKMPIWLARGALHKSEVFRRGKASRRTTLEPTPYLKHNPNEMESLLDEDPSIHDVQMSAAGDATTPSMTPPSEVATSTPKPKISTRYPQWTLSNFPSSDEEEEGSSASSDTQSEADESEVPNALSGADVSAVLDASLETAV